MSLFVFLYMGGPNLSRCTWTVVGWCVNSWAGVKLGAPTSCLSYSILLKLKLSPTLALGHILCSYDNVQKCICWMSSIACLHIALRMNFHVVFWLTISHSCKKFSFRPCLGGLPKMLVFVKSVLKLCRFTLELWYVWILFSKLLPSTPWFLLHIT